MISYQSLLSLLKQYTTQTMTDVDLLTRTIAFVESRGIFSTDRNWQSGHISGSAWILNPQATKTLLVYNKNLELWLNPGGHCEPFDATIQQTALREAQEETGLTSLRHVGEGIFDIDIHLIPARNKFPEHKHYDLRFLFVADDEEKLVRNHLTSDIQWVSLSDLPQFVTDASIFRLASKSRQNILQLNRAV